MLQNPLPVLFLLLTSDPLSAITINACMPFSVSIQVVSHNKLKL